MIRQVATNFVPVAINLYKVRAAKGPGGDLFRSVQRQQDQYQGIWIVSPEGKVLAAHHTVKDHKKWADEVLATIKAGLAAHGPVKPRKAERVDPLPHRGKGVQEGGAVSLALYTRYLHRGRRDGPAVLDSLNLPAREWAAFKPAKLEVGASWAVPKGVASQFSRALSPSSDQSTMPRPAEVTDVRITGTVETIEGGIARLRFRGLIKAAHRYDRKVSHGQATLEGVASYDVKAAQMRSLTFVFEGTHRAPPPYDAPRQTGAVVEWRHENVGE